MEITAPPIHSVEYYGGRTNGVKRMREGVAIHPELIHGVLPDGNLDEYHILRCTVDHQLGEELSVIEKDEAHRYPATGLTTEI